MYFGKQKNAKSYYYYNYDIDNYQEEKIDYLTFILKILIILLILLTFFITYLFISNKIEIVENKTNQTPIKVHSAVINTSKEESSDKLSQNDIANIISMVMKDIDEKKAQKQENINDNDYAQALILEDVDNLETNKINPESINTKKEIIENSSKLSKKNHYNKIVINKPKNETYSNDSLLQLSTKIDNAIDESSQEESTSEYTNQIKKEVAVRSNEMRVIVVQKGDTLSKIAKRAYGSYDAYMKIIEANPHIIKNPNEIFVGQRLRIPI